MISDPDMANIELGSLTSDLASLFELFELTAINQCQIESLIGIDPVLVLILPVLITFTSNLKRCAAVRPIWQVSS